MATTTRRGSGSKSAKTSSRKRDDSLAARAGRTLRDRPYASAAIATGAVTAVAAAAAGAFFFSRRNKSIGETADELGTLVKDGLDDASQAVRKMARKATGKSAKSQSEIAEEALTLKQTGKLDEHPADPAVAAQTKAGAVAY